MCKVKDFLSKKVNTKSFLQWLTNNWALLVTGFIMSLFLLYVLIKRQNILIPIHDNLDGGIDLYTFLRDNNLFFAHNCIVPFLGGIDRDFLPSELKLFSLIFILFSQFKAYIVVHIFRVLIAIIGFVCCNKIIFKSENNNIAIFIGFIYGFLPYYPAAGISFASLPLFFAMLYDSYKNFKIKHALFFLLYGFISDFVFFGIFICAYLILFLVVRSLMEKRINTNVIYAIICIVISYIVTEYRLFNIMLFNPVETNRIERITKYNDLIRQFQNNFLNALCLEQYHSGDFHSGIVFYIVSISVLFYIFYVIAKNINNVSVIFKKVFSNLFVIAYVIIILNSVCYALDKNWVVISFIEMILPSLKGFTFARALWLNPFLWYFEVFFILTIVNNKFLEKTKYILIYSLVLILMCRLLIFHDSQGYNIINLNYDESNKKIDKFLTYKEFYSESLFKKIKSDINYSISTGGKCVIVGAHPSILLHNGFHCLDGYMSMYPLQIKKNFAKIISPYLNLNGSAQKEYFNSWGQRLYVFCDDCGSSPKKRIKNKKINLKFSTKDFVEQGGKYVFSLYEIINADELELNLLKMYKQKDSIYKIYLYEAK